MNKHEYLQSQMPAHAPTSQDPGPQAVLGVLSTIEHLDGDGESENCSQALSTLQHAINSLNRQPRLDRVVQLGRALAAGNTPDLNNTATPALGAVKHLLSSLRIANKVHHVAGDYEQCCFSRHDLAMNPLGLRPCPAAGGAQCAVLPLAPGLQIVILDSYAESNLHCESAPEEEKLQRRTVAAESLAKRGITSKRRTALGGAFGSAQQDWLRGCLQEAYDAGQRVIVVGHLPVHPLAVHSIDSLAWDCTELREIMEDYPCVIMYMSGHDMEGGYCLGGGSVHHLGIPAAAVADHVTIEFHSSTIVIRGPCQIEINPGVRHIGSNFLQADSKLDLSTGATLKIR